MARNLAPETLAAQALGIIDEKTGALVPPVHSASTFLRDPDGGYSRGHVYARADNPTYKPVEDLLAVLEEGADAMVSASGMAAATSVFLALRPGDHVIVPKVMYWALRQWLVTSARDWGLEVSLVDTGNLDAIRAELRPGRTRLIWLETPANPTWELADIAAVAAIAREAGAKLAVDSTVATPVLSRPLTLGADIVMHSATKYLNGHSDIIAGALVAREDNDFWARIRMVRGQVGGILGAQESALLLRGMRTLHLRVRAASDSALFLAERLSGNPAVEKVLYPGLVDHPGHEIALRQMTGGFGGMLSIRLKGGETAAVAAAARVGLWKRATSLGGVESLIEHRASIEGSDTPVPADLLRLSVGIENRDDLLSDIEEALAASAQ